MRRTALTLCGLVLVVLSVSCRPAQHQVGAQDNAKLWAAVNDALGRFTAFGLSSAAGDLGGGYSYADIRRLTQLSDSFDAAVGDLEGVRPPAEQKIIGEELLPVYQDIADAMRTIVSSARDSKRTDTLLGWQRLQMLSSEASSLASLLITTAPASDFFTTPTPSPSLSVTPIPVANSFERVSAKGCAQFMREPGGSEAIACVPHGYIAESDARTVTVAGAIWRSVREPASGAWGWTRDADVQLVDARPITRQAAEEKLGQLGFALTDAKALDPTQPFNAVIGIPFGTQTRYEQQVFFFFGRQYLGNDAKDPSASVGFAARGPDTIPVEYGLFATTDEDCCPTSGLETVRFAWTHGHVRAMDPIPPADPKADPSRR